MTLKLDYCEADAAICAGIELLAMDMFGEYELTALFDGGVHFEDINRLIRRHIGVVQQWTEQVASACRVVDKFVESHHAFLAASVKTNPLYGRFPLGGLVDV
jgi:hypothetical protein